MVDDERRMTVMDLGATGLRLANLQGQVISETIPISAADMQLVARESGTAVVEAVTDGGLVVAILTRVNIGAGEWALFKETDLGVAHDT